MKKDKTKYFTYKHVRDDNKEVFYIGIGKIEIKDNPFKKYHRAYQTWSRNRFWKSVVNKTTYSIIILKEFYTREACEEEEVRLIKLYGRRNLNKGTLVNLTDGGEGLKGCRPVNAKEVHQYSLNGDYITSFNTITEAEKQIKINNISACCRGIINTAGKYQWSYKKQDKIQKVKYHSAKSSYKKVLQLDLNDNIIKEFESIHAASMEIKGSKVGTSTISQCCNGIEKTYLGYKWKFKKEKDDNNK